MRIAILGGSGAFGSWYARLFIERGHSVIVTPHKGPVGTEFTSDNKEAIKGAELVILSVPAGAMEKVINEIIDLVEPGALLVDFASVKSEICAELEKHKSGKIEIASVHPMHGPRVLNLKMRPVILIPIKIGEKYKWLKRFFEDEKANILETNAKEHDESLAIVQGLTHFSSIVSASTINRLGYDVDSLKSFSSPNYNLLVSLMSRVVLQDPRLYADIQIENKKSNEIRRLFIDIAKKLADAAENEKKEEISEIIEDGAKIFHNIEKALFESDKVVEAVNSEINYLSKRIGQKIVVKNVLTRKFHYGKLIELSGKEMTILDNSREIRLLISNIITLRDEEIIAWKKINLKKISRDYSFLIGEKVDEKELVGIFSSIQGICDTAIIDIFRSDKFKGRKSIAIKMNIFEDENLKEVEDLIVRRIKAFDYELRE